MNAFVEVSVKLPKTMMDARVQSLEWLREIQSGALEKDDYELHVLAIQLAQDVLNAVHIATE